MAFPTESIDRALRNWWKDQTKSPLRRKSADPGKTGGNVFDLQPEVSSQEAVNVFLEVEPFVGFEIKGGNMVKKGGYENCEDFVKDLLPKLEAEYRKQHPVITRSSTKPATGVATHASHH